MGSAPAVAAGQEVPFKLGTFDVYSWGVLHHTGQMWQASENFFALVTLGAPTGTREVDSVGPYPLEVANPEENFDFYRGGNFELLKAEDLRRWSWLQQIHLKIEVNSRWRSPTDDQSAAQPVS